MKNQITQNYRGILLATMAALFVLAGAGSSRADDWGGHQRYYDRDGFWDGHHHYRHYDTYHNHRGYWDERNGFRVFINVG